jgi:hypothetical protein
MQEVALRTAPTFRRPDTALASDGSGRRDSDYRRDVHIGSECGVRQAGNESKTWKIDPRKAQIGPSSDSGGRFLLLATCPEQSADRFRRRAERAATSYQAAVELKCLECCAWERPEVKRCEIVGCPLWSLSRGIFKPGRAA